MTTTKEYRMETAHQARGPIIIVGAGHGGSQVAFSLRQGGHAGPILLLNGEADAPYQRPPLSKAYLTGKVDPEDLLFRPASFYDEQRIECRTGRVLRIDRAAQEVHLADGSRLGYAHLVLATGGHARPLTVPGSELAGVHALRTLEDARPLRELLASASRIAVVGAGFIGLEFAAVAAQQGLPVTVIEALDRPMARAVSPLVSTLFREAHAGWGVQWRLGAAVQEIVGAGGRVTGVRCSDGTVVDADLVVYGIGMIPNVELAREAGLEVDNGIVVDERLLTSDPVISAIGDVASFPDAFTGRRLRLESVQNAADQGRHVAARLLGQDHAYAACPWFWSDQGQLKLQIAGLPAVCDEFVPIGQGDAAHSIVLGFGNGRLLAMETVNRAAEHMMARRALAAGKSLSPAEAREPGFDFKAWGRAALAA
jgi:3-phenylpropionate/trans-cinnamate dioxygenase ferredoxin reductase subunit